MAKVIVLQKADGSIALVYPVEPKGATETPAQHLARIEAKARLGDPELATATRINVVEQSELPSRRWRAQWRANGGNIEANLIAVKQARLQELRNERNVLLTATDVTSIKLQENGTAVQKVAFAAYRQALRDLTVTVQTQLNALNWPVEVEAYVPTWPTYPANVTP